MTLMNSSNAFAIHNNLLQKYECDIMPPSRYMLRISYFAHYNTCCLVRNIALYNLALFGGKIFRKKMCIIIA